MRGPNYPTPANTQQYIDQQAPEVRPMLTQLCDIIRAACPQATESISYQLPCFKYLYMLVGIGVNKSGCSFYTMSPGLIKLMKAQLQDVKVSGTTLHFKPGTPLPVALLTDIVKARMKDNEILAMAKSK